MRDIRAAVLRDLAWLLNSRSHRPDDAVHDFEAVAKSVVNFGVPALTGESASSLRPEKIRRSLHEAIRRFEPRISPDTLQIKVDVTPDTHGVDALTIEISGDLLVQPSPEWLSIETRLDPLTGETTLSRYLDVERLHGSVEAEQEDG